MSGFKILDNYNKSFRLEDHVVISKCFCGLGFVLLTLQDSCLLCSDVPIDNVSLMPEKQLSAEDRGSGRIAGIVVGIIVVILAIAVVSSISWLTVY